MRHWKIISALVAILGEGALQISGFQCIPLAIGLALLAIGLLLWSAWPTLVKLRFQSPVTLKSSDKETKLIVTGAGTAKTDKLQTVLEAISEARQITPKGKVVRVYITGTNGLITMLPEELKSILLKLQKDDKVLVLKSFPEGMIATGKSAAEHLHFSLMSMNDPSLTSFTVSLRDEFDKYIKNEKN